MKGMVQNGQWGPGQVVEILAGKLPVTVAWEKLAVEGRLCQVAEEGGDEGVKVA